MTSRTIDRRTVLTAAAAGGAAVATSRLLGGTALGRVNVVEQPAKARTGLDWISPLDREDARVAHLLRRTSFGYTEAELERARADGYARTVERLLTEHAAEPAPFPNGDLANQMQALRMGDLQAWWINWMIISPTPLIERLTMFWHSHFTSDARKVGTQSPFMYWQNQTWRRFALGELGPMLHQVTADPAMLRYLDLASSSARNPNENYARELMELFTMGSGTFSEDDVKAGSRALAGWRTPRTAAMVQGQIDDSIKRTGKPPARPPTADTATTGIFERARAHKGALTFLGETRQWDTESIIARILQQPTTAPYLARKLAVQFVTPRPSDAYVATLAESFRSSGYSVRELMRKILTSPEFTAPTSYRALVKSPVEYMVSVAKALGNPALSRLIANSGGAMGMTLFDPPTVGGWPNNESWISSNAMLMRTNYVSNAVTQTRKLLSSIDSHLIHLDGVLGPQTLRLLNDAADEKRRWTLLLSSPEFQLK